MMILRTRFRRLLSIALLALPLAGPAFSQEDAPPSPTAKVFVVPMKGPLRYRMAATEMNKIIRSAMVQKPEALVLVISSPGGDRQIAFDIAQQLADLGTAEHLRLRLGRIWRCVWYCRLPIADLPAGICSAI